MLFGFSLYHSPHLTHFPYLLGLTERRPSLLTLPLLGSPRGELPWGAYLTVHTEAMLPEGRPQAVMGLAGAPAPHEGPLKSSSGLGLPVILVDAFPEPELSCRLRLLLPSPSCALLSQVTE